MNENLKRKISDALDLPKDIVLNVPKVTVTGRIAAFVKTTKASSNIILIGKSEYISWNCMYKRKRPL